jgi:hypothetical protein
LESVIPEPTDGEGGGRGNTLTVLGNIIFEDNLTILITHEVDWAVEIGQGIPECA